ncbi:hypothetical protein ACFPJA_12235 [Halorubrum glutamatedens]|uniref:Uncharacterized protein n=2 Tax=Halobacteriales TaxID=2235 RepID=A0ABD5QT68_9EURY
MIDFQEDVLNDSHICRNCFALRRRAVEKTLRWEGSTTYHERVRWNTVVDDIPDVPTSESRTLFCECGAPSAYVRIWEDHEIDAPRLREFLKNLYEALTAKGYDVDVRQLARGADEAYHKMPPAGIPGRGIGPHQPDDILEIDAILKQAVGEGIQEPPDKQVINR